MAVLAAEACIHIREAEDVLGYFFNGMLAYCASIYRLGSDYILMFDGSKAIVRIEPGTVWLRVEADDLTVRLGTKTLIEAELSRHTEDMPNCLLWIETDREPFAAIMAYEQKPLT